MQEKEKARLCELAPVARRSLEAGFTQPFLHLFWHICTEIWSEEIIAYSNNLV